MLINKDNPVINTFEQINAMQGEEFKPFEEGFAMAIGLEDYTTKEAKNDPTIIKWIARYLRYEDSQIIENRVEPLHTCTDDDFKLFTPPEDRSMSRLEQLKGKGGLFCIDWEAVGFKLYGSPSDAVHSVIDVVAVPCGMRETVLGASQDNIRDDCNWD